jgi:hypothetical protein
MNHTVTIGGVLLILGMVAGLGMVAIGAMVTIAEGMSDAPSSGSGGCITAAAGLALLVGCILGLVL